MHAFLLLFDLLDVLTLGAELLVAIGRLVRKAARDRGSRPVAAHGSAWRRQPRDAKDYGKRRRRRMAGMSRQWGWHRFC